MQKKWFVTTGVLMFFLVAAVPGFSSDQKQTTPVDKAGGAQNPGAPTGGIVLIVKDPRTSTTVKVPFDSTVHDDLSVAVVNDEPITVEDLKRTIAAAHEEGDEGKKGKVTEAPKIDFNVMLQRLINVELVIQEAKTIGLDELPEVKDPIDVFSRVSLRDLLRQDVSKGITADEGEVEKAYRENIREVKTTGVFFKKEKDAKKAVKEIKAGKSFDEVIAKGKKGQIIKEINTGYYVKFKDLSPEIAAAISKMKIGSLSPVMKIVLAGDKTYFALFRLDDDRSPESADAKEQARQMVLWNKTDKALEALSKSLREKYVKEDKGLIESLDYGSEGQGLEKLLEDKRVAVEIEGDQPITVAQLSEAMQDKFYHGMKNLKGEKMIRTKHEVLDNLIQQRLFILEAKKRGLDKTAEYKNMVEEYERDTLWGAFIQKVAIRDVKMQDEDLRAYYHDHAGDYLSPKMVMIRSLAFGKEADAIAALEKLRKGADFNWVKDKMEGQLDPNTKDLMTFEEQLVPIDTLDPNVQEALSGVNAEDFRLFQSPQGHFHVLYIPEVVPPQQQPFEQVQVEIRNKVFSAKLNAAMNEWIRKLKESADIKVYLAGSEK
ncbi:MAG TPA: peptidylprolyl isomerase [Nitrospirota bacterium]|nr:peptidylprolyl isomerase [Nitrospirota bacterium]